MASFGEAKLLATFLEIDIPTRIGQGPEVALKVAKLPLHAIFLHVSHCLHIAHSHDLSRMLHNVACVVASWCTTECFDEKRLPGFRAGLSGLLS